LRTISVAQANLCIQLYNAGCESSFPPDLI
jgi:hypothetical protein